MLIDDSHLFTRTVEKGLLSSNKFKVGDETYRQKKRGCMGFWRKFYYFHVESPLVRFYEHTIGYLLFLMLFSYVAMKEKKINPGECEILLIVTVVGYAVGELYQLSCVDASPFLSKIITYFSDFWNKFDLLCIAVFFIALILRCTESTIGVGHVLYAIDVSLWIIRVIHILYADPKSGPYVVMIGKMFNDIMHVLVILLILSFL